MDEFDQKSPSVKAYFQMEATHPIIAEATSCLPDHATPEYCCIRYRLGRDHLSK
jgi:hypothetical protein